MFSLPTLVRARTRLCQIGAPVPFCSPPRRRPVHALPTLAGFCDKRLIRIGVAAPTRMQIRSATALGVLALPIIFSAGLPRYMLSLAAASLYALAALGLP